MIYKKFGSVLLMSNIHEGNGCTSRFFDLPLKSLGLLRLKFKVKWLVVSAIVQLYGYCKR